MEALEDITWPRPLAELLEPMFETYRGGHPWVADEELSPKSVARDLSERAMTFVEYVGFYGLARSEGLVLRYLADAYRALRRTVPDRGAHRGGRGPPQLARRAGAPGRLVAAGGVGGARATPARSRCPPPSPSTSGRRRSPPTSGRSGCWCATRVFRRVELFALRRWIDLGELDPEFGQDAWESSIRAYFDEHDELGTGAGRARAGAVLGERGAGSLGGPADARRPARRPRLGARRDGRPRRPRTMPARRCCACGRPHARLTVSRAEAGCYSEPRCSRSAICTARVAL